MFSGALGLVLFKDPFQRFHAAGKVSLFGLGLLILGDCMLSEQIGGETAIFATVGVFFLLFVGPFASHVLASSLLKQRSKH